MRAVYLINIYSMARFFWIWEDDNKLMKAEWKDEIWQIVVDILEWDLEIIILAPIAGIYLEDIDLSFSNSVLTISWNREKPDIFSENTTIRNSECFWWKFSRNIILPENLDFDSIKATMENNLLIIIIKKLQFTSQNIKIDRVEWEF